MILTDKLLWELKKDRGVRIGHTAVVSRKVHSIYPEYPQNVNIIVNADAGRVFYNRIKEGDIVHIDLFHEIATCDVKHVANCILSCLSHNQYDTLLEYIDIQTGVGGGKLTGSLEYGRTESLKKDHLNHVHITGLIDDAKLGSVFLIVEAIEGALLHQGIELRKVEKIKHELGKNPMDMSPYMTNSDSNLQEENSSGCDGKTYSEAIQMVNHFGSVKTIEETLESIKNPINQKLKNIKKQNSDYDDIMRYCKEKNFTRKQPKGYKLTQEGEELYDVFRLQRRELERILKATIRSIPKLEQNKGLIVSPSSKTRYWHTSGGPRISMPLEKGVQYDELDIVTTAKNALVKCHFEKSDFGISEEDIFVADRMPKSDQDICLLLDASASMAGHRLRNAKYLAKHLILKPQRRVSVLAFQEKDVETYVPFTKDFDVLEDGINRIMSVGLTPLALALDKGIKYVGSKNLRNPLIMLITDGIPTVAMESSDPIKDAINVAMTIARKRINFCCIGLQPNKDCLVKITCAAKGKLFIVDELNRDVLLEVARKSGQLL